MSSRSRSNRGAGQPVDPLGGSLPKLPIGPADHGPSAFDLVAEVLPSMYSATYSSLELPVRKAAFLRLLGSPVVQDVEFGIEHLRDWMIRSPAVGEALSEVLQSPEARQVFSSKIRSHVIHDDGAPERSSRLLRDFPMLLNEPYAPHIRKWFVSNLRSSDASLFEIVVASTLAGLDHCPISEARRARLQGRLLARLVMVVPEALPQHLSRLEESGAGLLRSFAVASVFERPRAPPFARASLRCREMENAISCFMNSTSDVPQIFLSGGAPHLGFLFSTGVASILRDADRPVRREGHILEPAKHVQLEGYLYLLYQWAKGEKEGAQAGELAARMSYAMETTKQIARLSASLRSDGTPRKADVDLKLLNFAFSISREFGTEITNLLTRGGSIAELTPTQEKAVSFLGEQLLNDRKGVLARLLVTQPTLNSLIQQPEEMLRLVERAKDVIDEEALKNAPGPETYLSKVRLDLLTHAQSFSPSLAWWKLLALIDSEETATVLAPLLTLAGSSLSENLIEWAMTLLPYAKNSRDFVDALELVCPLEREQRFIPTRHSKHWTDRKLSDDTVRHFLLADRRDVPVSKKVGDALAVLEKITKEGSLKHFSLVTNDLWIDPVLEAHTYCSFVRTFGRGDWPTLYAAYRAFSAGTKWGEFANLDDLLAYRTRLLSAVCNDEVRTDCSAPLVRELLEQICHLSTTHYGDKTTGVSVLQTWGVVEASRRAARQVALAPAPQRGQSHKSWGEQRAAATRAEAAWNAFMNVGPVTMNLALQKSFQEFSFPVVYGANDTMERLVSQKRGLKESAADFAERLSEQTYLRDLLQSRPVPPATDDKAICAWQRELLRAAVESVAESAEKRPICDFGVSLLTLRVLMSPGGNQKRYLRYNEALDNYGEALLWADIAAGLFEGTLADEYLLPDVAWDAERRQTFLTHLRANLPCDFMLKALEQRRSLAPSHPEPQQVGESCAITMIPTRGIARELSGYLFDVCWASNEKVFCNGKDVDDGRPNIMSVTFVRDYGTPNATIVGGSLVVVGYTTDNPQQPVMIIRGCNPRRSFLNDIYVGEFFEKWLGYLSDVAQSAQSAAPMPIVIPRDPVPFLALTNQPDLYYYARSNYFSGKPANVGSVALTEFNGIRVGDRLISIRHSPSNRAG